MKFKPFLSKLILSSFAINVNIIIIFSYFNNWQVTIQTNLFNEGYIEMIFVPLVTIFAIYYVFRGE